MKKKIKKTQGGYSCHTGDRKPLFPPTSYFLFSQADLTSLSLLAFKHMSVGALTPTYKYKLSKIKKNKTMPSLLRPLY